MTIIWTAADKWCQTIQAINGRSKVVVMKVSSRLQPVNDIKPYRKLHDFKNSVKF